MMNEAITCSEFKLLWLAVLISKSKSNFQYVCWPLLVHKNTFFRFLCACIFLLGNTFSRAFFSGWAEPPAARVGGLESAQMLGDSLFIPLKTSSLCQPDGRAITTRRALGSLGPVLSVLFPMSNHSLVDSKSVWVVLKLLLCGWSWSCCCG